MRRKKTQKPEDILVTQLSIVLQSEFPEQPFRFDQVDQIGKTNGMRHKMLHGIWSRGYPDLFIPKKTKKYAGLMLELKATTKLEDTEHTRVQGWYHSILRELGYKCEFCVGFDECVKKLRKYLR